MRGGPALNNPRDTFVGLKNLEEVVKPWFRELPGQYTNYMRKILRDPTLVLAWAPDFQRKTYRRNKPVDLAVLVTDPFGVQTDRGCFVVLKVVRRAWLTFDDTGVGAMHSTKEHYIQHVFDGEGGEPVVPHARFLEACIDTDKCRHGAERERKLDRNREARIRRIKADRDKMAKDAASDNQFFKALRDFGQEAGMSAPDKDTMKEMEAVALREGARIDRMDQAEYKAVKAHTERKDEELL